MDSPIGENPILLGTARRPYQYLESLQQKNHIQLPGGTRCRIQMNKNSHSHYRRHRVDYAAAAVEQMDEYCATHPRSASAVRRPQLFFRGDLWVALLGPSFEEGIVGIGPTVAAALRAFDAQYLAGLRPPNERNKSVTKRGRAVQTTAALLAVLLSSILPGL